MQKQNHSKKTPQKNQARIYSYFMLYKHNNSKKHVNSGKKKTQNKPLLFLELCNACSIL